jgi:hypothetical protein
MRKVSFPVEDRQRVRLSEMCHGESDAWTAEDGGTLIQNEL